MVVDLAAAEVVTVFVLVAFVQVARYAGEIFQDVECAGGDVAFVARMQGYVSAVGRLVESHAFGVDGIDTSN